MWGGRWNSFPKGRWKWGWSPSISSEHGMSDVRQYCYLLSYTEVSKRRFGEEGILVPLAGRKSDGGNWLGTRQWVLQGSLLGLVWSRIFYDEAPLLGLEWMWTCGLYRRSGIGRGWSGGANNWREVKYR